MKPDPYRCPGTFCFMWKGSRREEDLNGEQVAEHCMNDFGLCIRLDPLSGDRDWYEPDEPDLRAMGLPWFYFIPTPEILRKDWRDRYITESEELWGNAHWKNDGAD